MVHLHGKVVKILPSMLVFYLLKELLWKMVLKNSIFLFFFLKETYFLNSSSFFFFTQGHITVHFDQGDFCGNPSRISRETNIRFVCNPNVQTYKLDFYEENPACVYNFIIETQYACPISKGPQKVVCPLRKYFFFLISNLSNFTFSTLLKKADLIPLNVFVVPHTHDVISFF